CFNNQLQPQETAVPASVKEFLYYALAVLDSEENSLPALTQIQVKAPTPDPSPKNRGGGTKLFSCASACRLDKPGAEAEASALAPPRPLWERGLGGEGLVWSGPLLD